MDREDAGVGRVHKQVQVKVKWDLLWPKDFVIYTHLCVQRVRSSPTPEGDNIGQKKVHIKCT